MFATTPLRSIRRAVGAVVVATVLVAAAAPAGAQQDSPRPTTTAPAGTAPTTTAAVGLAALLPSLEPLGDGATMDQLRGRYGTLSASLVAMYANQVGQPLDAFVAARGAELAGALGSTTDPGALAGSFTGGDLAALNRSLEQGGLAVDWRSGPSMADYSRRLAANAESLEARMVAAGASWAADLAAVRGGAPGRPDLGAAPSIDSLAVGLFADRAATAMITDFPDLFAQVRSSGVGTPEAAAAWRQSMVTALAASDAAFASALPNSCYGAMMTAMASGDANAARSVAGGNCGSCVATGLYLNGQLSRLFDPQMHTLNPTAQDKLLPPAEFNQLQPWQRNALSSQNPSLRTSMSAGDSLATALPSGCNTNGTARDTARTVLPGVFNQLQTRR